jgi:hypothetical protein
LDGCQVSTVSTIRAWTVIDARRVLVGVVVANPYPDRMNGFRGDESRKRRDPELIHRQSRDIVRRHKKGESVRGIAAAMNLHRNTVWRVIKDFHQAGGSGQVAAAPRPPRPPRDADDDAGLHIEGRADLDAELAALLSKLEPSPAAEDITSVEEAMQLSALELWRVESLPLDHPARALVSQPVEAGYRPSSWDVYAD